MTIDEYAKSIGFPKMKLLGEMKNFAYYIQKDIPKDEMIGVPIVIVENKKKNSFDVCDSDMSLNAIDLFGKEK